MLLKAYHGTNAPPFERFEPAMRGTATDDGELGSGYYFSTDPQVARGRKTLMEVQVRLRRPLLLELPKWTANKRKIINDALGTTGLRGIAITSALLAQGYDGAILDYAPVGYHHMEIVALDTSQIKIAKAERIGGGGARARRR